MFPSKLQKSIQELDKQISLLETECENIESENNATGGIGGKGTCRGVTGRRIVQAIPKECSEVFEKTHEGSGVVIIEEPSGSAPSLPNDECKSFRLPPKKGKPWGGIQESSVEGEKEDAEPTGEILHKEFLLTKAGETIEVTVTHKGKHLEATRKTVKGLSGETLAICPKHKNKLNGKCKERTWNQILCEQCSPEKWKEKKRKTGEEERAVVAYKDEEGCQKLCEDGIVLCANDAESIPQGGSPRMSERSQGQGGGRKRRSRSARTRRKHEGEIPSEDMSRGLREKETQCLLWREEREGRLDNLDESVKALHILVEDLKKKQPEEKEDVLNEIQDALLKLRGVRTAQSDQHCLNVVKGEDFRFSECKDICFVDGEMVVNALRQICEDLNTEKLALTRELKGKDEAMTEMKGKEKEYLTLIANLKVNLERVKKQAEEGIGYKKELDEVKNKLQEETKVMEMLKRNHVKMQELVQKYVLDNDKLRTRMKLAELESQKCDVLLAGKEAEIRRYKTEMESFQRQISEHLNVLRSKASGNDVENAIEVITRQTNILSQTEVESETTGGCSRTSSLLSLWTRDRPPLESNSKDGGRRDAKEALMELQKISSDSVGEEKEKSGKDGGYRSCKSESDGSDSKDGEGGKSLKTVPASSKILGSNFGAILHHIRGKHSESGSGVRNARERVTSSSDASDVEGKA